MSITVEQIPDEVVMALRGAIDRSKYLDAAIVAALNVWPGASISYRPHWRGRDQEVTLVECLIIPLPQEGK